MLAKAAREQVQAAVAALDDDHHDEEMKQDGMVSETFSTAFSHSFCRNMVISELYLANSFKEINFI